MGVTRQYLQQNPRPATLSHDKPINQNIFHGTLILINYFRLLNLSADFRAFDTQNPLIFEKKRKIKPTKASYRSVLLRKL